MAMKDNKMLGMPNLISRLLSGGALWRAAARRGPSTPVKRVDSWLSISLARMNRARLR